MKIFIFDFETTGLPDYNKRARDPSQPHIVEASAGLYDENGCHLEELNTVVKPDGWIIPPEVEAIHGITTAFALSVGSPEKEVIQKLLDMWHRADLVSSYNLTFDKFLLRIAARRFELMQDEDSDAWKEKPGLCIMRKLQPVCGLGKYPKLHEAYRHCFKQDLADTHSAEKDRSAAAVLLFWLVNEGKVTL